MEDQSLWGGEFNGIIILLTLGVDLVVLVGKKLSHQKKALYFVASQHGMLRQGVTISL